VNWLSGLPASAERKSLFVHASSPIRAASLDYTTRPATL
jgi:hypothetical protein